MTEPVHNKKPQKNMLRTIMFSAFDTKIRIFQPLEHSPSKQLAAET
jgi:hypothetical protein